MNDLIKEIEEKIVPNEKWNEIRDYIISSQKEIERLKWHIVIIKEAIENWDIKYKEGYVDFEIPKEIRDIVWSDKEMSEKEYIFVGNAQLKTRDYIKQIEKDNREKDKEIERLHSIIKEVREYGKEVLSWTTNEPITDEIGEHILDIVDKENI